MTIFMPSAAKRSAMASPMPLATPVTTATRPRSVLIAASLYAPGLGMSIDPASRLTSGALLPTMGAVMADQHADVVVVGGGIVGSATAYYLARRGARVVVLERGEAPGEQSRKNWGFVRQQGRDPSEVPLMMEANRIWRGLEAELGADIEWVQGGNLGLAATAERMALFEEWLGVARQFGLDTRLLRPADLPAVVPGLVPGWAGGLHTPSDGHADPG